MSVQRLVRMGLAGFVLGTSIQAVASAESVSHDITRVVVDGRGPLPVVDAVVEAAVTDAVVAIAAARLHDDSGRAPEVQAVVMPGQRFDGFVRREAADASRSRAPIAAGARGLTAGPVDHARDAAARVDDEAAAFTEREVYALIAAGLIAVLSLSRRRNL